MAVCDLAGEVGVGGLGLGGGGGGGGWGEEWGEREEITCGSGAVGDEGEDLGDETLLDRRIELGIEFGQTWLA